MYIQEVIIDGFKSYAQRTVVSGFDPQFNAITGLNGTGKSNILDSICFVLGISNLSQVRVGNLQELVYKQGQAGVTKATVTIVFNNTDSSCSPVGYETHKQITVTRQVVIGGKNKYMINGHTVQQNQVQNLFHSVQLNVNNPHFLIMQGRITKVLNMKPEETLSMIEEAAGTRMFETKKQAAIKTIEKKQLKVDELSKCMNEEITPTLENLRTERQQYQSWLSNNSEVERLERFCIAFEYKQSEEKVSVSEGDKLALTNELETLQVTQTEKTQEANECAERIAEIEKQRESEADGPLQQLKAKENTLSKELVKINTLLNNHNETLNAEKEVQASLTKQIDGVQKTLKSKNFELTASAGDYERKNSEVVEAETRAADLREKYQNACAGVADVSSSADLLSIPEQIGAWEKAAREAQSKLQQGTLKAHHAKESIKELKKQQGSQKSSHQVTATEAQRLREVVDALAREIETHSQSNLDENNLKSQISKFRKAIAESNDNLSSLSAQLEARLAFEFRDPVKGFDRSKVKGLVARLVRVRDQRTATALEIVAGAKLYQVVVDSSDTGKQLLQNGGLRKRVTILPLNKIDNRCMDPAKVDAAKRLASTSGGSAHLALELVGYDEEVMKAMQNVFGNAIICDNADLAKAIAFDQKIRVRTVTLDGDVYDPSGTLTGGSKNEIGMLLSRLSSLAAQQEAHDLLVQQLSSLETQSRDNAAVVARVREAESSMILSQQELQICEDKLNSSTYSELEAKILEHETLLAEFEKETVELNATIVRANDELMRLKGAESGVKKQREKAMKDMESQMKASQRLATSLKQEVTALKSKKDSDSAEVVALQSELAALVEQLEICSNTIARLTKDGNTLFSQVSECRAQYDNAKQALSDKQAELNQCSKEIKTWEASKDKFLKAAQAASLEARKITHKLKQWEKDSKDAARALVLLQKQHPWIAQEKSYFGVAGSDFDFASKDTAAAQARLKQIKSEQDKLGKKVNKKVMGMIEKAESEYLDLSKKREVILNDKAKIEAVIEELDVKKAQALQTTWIKVNRDFGSIFSTLLPGTTAKLDPLEGCAVSEGLEVKVAFNGVWKESLTELSGGQRSLLALSLILSLLLFKPAPMYILDEVDAALDLSHTQNIGLMLRTHFSASQFIVVSLKEGMFNNANVIFRTKFVDGVSAVTRTVVNPANRSAAAKTTAGLLTSKPASETEVEENENIAPNKKKGRKAN